MPQTLLGLLALTILAQLTFSQQRVTMKAQQNQLRDEFSVAASGMLMEAMELLAARPFDAESSPQRIITQGLPSVGDFGSLGHGAGEIDCNLFEIDLDDCNDLDDFSRATWWPAEVELSNGHSLPFEVQVSVAYVDGTAPDTEVFTPTTSKRVTLRVRTPMLPTEGTFIHLERVVAYDPNKAAADCVQFYEDDTFAAANLAMCSTLR